MPVLISMIAEQHLLALPAGYRLGKYIFKGLLGSGGFGITYLAEDTSLHRKVAIKEMLPNEFATRLDGTTVVAKTQSDKTNLDWARARFVDEGRALAACDHPNVIDVYEMIEANGTAYMVTKYEEGNNFERWVQKLGRKPSESDLREILFPLLSGLERVHRAGFLHRDIKPENIYITDEGRPVLLDFGSARQAIRSRSMVMTSIITPGYAPFEQYHEDGDQGAWTDIYAMGAVMYRAINGKKPPDAISRLASDTCEKLAVAYVGRYSNRFLTAVDCALKVKESERPQTVADWREMLGADSGLNQAVQATDNTGFYAAKKPAKAGLPIMDFVRRNPKWVFGGGGVLVAALIGICIFALSKQNSNPPGLVPISNKPVAQLTNVDSKTTDEKTQLVPTPTPTATPVVNTTPVPTPVVNETPASTALVGGSPEPTPHPAVSPTVVAVVPQPSPVTTPVPVSTPPSPLPGSSAAGPNPVGTAGQVDPALVGIWQTKLSKESGGGTVTWEINKDGTWTDTNQDGETESGTLTTESGKIHRLFKATNETLDLTYQLKNGRLVTVTHGATLVWSRPGTSAQEGPSREGSAVHHPHPRSTEGRSGGGSWWHHLIPFGH